MNASGKECARNEAECAGLYKRSVFALRRGASLATATEAIGVNAGHETLAEIQRHTKDAEDKALARSGAEKRRRASQGLAAPRSAAQSGNGQVTTLPARSYNPGHKSLKS